ncbi:hypothetical protein EAF04_000146 [Stromatinia cepivora]|nr:hypothetical protein EAF04_000146 [Stromatinia cepivora]
MQDTIMKDIAMEDNFIEEIVMDDIMMEDIELDDAVMEDIIMEDTIMEDTIMEDRFMEDIYMDTIMEDIDMEDTIMQDVSTPSSYKLWKTSEKAHLLHLYSVHGMIIDATSGRAHASRATHTSVVKDMIQEARKHRPAGELHRTDPWPARRYSIKVTRRVAEEWIREERLVADEWLKERLPTYEMALRAIIRSEEMRKAKDEAGRWILASSDR